MWTLALGGATTISLTQQEWRDFSGTGVVCNFHFGLKGTAPKVGRTANAKIGDICCVQFVLPGTLLLNLCSFWVL